MKKLIDSNPEICAKIFSAMASQGRNISSINSLEFVKMLTALPATAQNYVLVPYTYPNVTVPGAFELFAVLDQSNLPSGLKNRVFFGDLNICYTIGGAPPIYTPENVRLTAGLFVNPGEANFIQNDIFSSVMPAVSDAPIMLSYTAQQRIFQYLEVAAGGANCAFHVDFTGWIAYYD